MTSISSDTHRSLPFVELAATGKNNWWRYVVSIPAIVAVAMAFVFASVVLLRNLGFSGVLDNLSSFDAESLSGDLRLSVLTFALALSMIAWYLFAVLIIVPIVHQRPWRTLIHVGCCFNWAGFFISLLIVVLVAPIELLFELFKEDPDLIVTFEGQRFFAFALVAILFLPFQILAEEVFFRGYILQGIAAITSQFWVRLLIPAIFFAAAHSLNTEVVGGGLWAMAIYLTIGLYLGMLVFRGNGLEYAAGFHLGNNLVVALIVSTPDSSLGTPTIFRISEVDWGVEMIVGTIVFFAIHYFVVFKLLRPFHDRSTG